MALRAQLWAESTLLRLELAAGDIHLSTPLHHVHELLVLSRTDNEGMRFAALASCELIELFLDRNHEHVILEQHVNLGFSCLISESPDRVQVGLERLIAQQARRQPDSPEHGRRMR